VGQATEAQTLPLTLLLLGLMALAGVAGCAPANPPPVAAQPATISAGTILSMRAVYAHASDDPLHAALLTDSARANDRSRSLVEFIVRADDGATLSIVQVNEAGFHTGDRVVILHDETTHLARPG
jgi:outer membrane lipoprotein SlyB